MADMREAFETDYFGDLPEVQARERSGSGYKYSVVQSAWSIWRAAWTAALASPPVAVQEEGDAWQTIETAPKDTGSLLLWNGYACEGFWHDGSECHGHRGGEGWFDESDRGNLLIARNIHPTHWMEWPNGPAMKGDQP